MTTLKSGQREPRSCDGPSVLDAAGTRGHHHLSQEEDEGAHQGHHGQGEEELEPDSMRCFVASVALSAARVTPVSGRRCAPAGSIVRTPFHPTDAGGPRCAASACSVGRGEGWAHGLARVHEPLVRAGGMAPMPESL